MAVIRCPQCNVPLTHNEARAGTCPDCKSALPASAFTEEPRGYPSRERSSSISEEPRGSGSLDYKRYGGAESRGSPYRSMSGYGKPLADLGARLGGAIVDI